MSAERVFVRRASYHDSVTLMLASNEAGKRDRVTDATAAMATPLNLELLARQGFHVDADALSPNDLVVAVRAEDDAALEDAIAAIEARLAARPAGTSAEVETPLRSMRAAARARPGLNLAFLSVPGRNVTYEIAEALDAGLNVFCFSDGPDLAAEARLKQRALAQGLLLMGPDCGTAILDGVAFGFANAVRPGPVGLVAASGTGAQQVMCMLDTRDVGVSHCLGVGGRDLSAAVSGRSTRGALALLDDDPATELIVLVSKPPDPAVAAEITAYAGSLGTPVLLALLGRGNGQTSDLTDVARRAVEAVGGTWAEPWSWGDQPAPTPGGALRGLFAGGTLCDEAMLIAATELGDIRSNIPLRPEWAVGADLRADGHLMLDFGDDALTQGRAHPMIDQRSRVDRIAVEAADPRCSVVLLDVVLGHGAHPDPSAELAPAIAAAVATARDGGRELAVVVSLCATQDEPQDPRRQAEALHGAGASVFLSNAAAARHAVALVTAGGAA